MKTVNADDPRSPSVQIADDLRAQIVSGELKAGARLPSGRTLARQYGVALMTVQNALQRLKDEGRVYSSSGRGYFVDEPTRSASDGEAPTFAERLRSVEAEVRELRSRVETLESNQ